MLPCAWLRIVDVLLCLVRAQAYGGALHAYERVTVTLSHVHISGCTASATGGSNSHVSAALRRHPRMCRSPGCHAGRASACLVRAALRPRSVAVVLCLVRVQVYGGVLYANAGVNVTLSAVQISGCTASATRSSDPDVSAALRRHPRTHRSPGCHASRASAPGARCCAGTQR